MAHFLLLHGACHGGWCWDAVTPALTVAGHQVTAPDLPCDDVHAGLREYADVAIASLPDGLAAEQDLLVVGHSLGALTAATVASRIGARRLTFLAGIIGEPGKSLEMLAEQDADRDQPLTDEDLAFDDEGRFCFSAHGAHRVLFHDCPDDVAADATAKLRFQRSLWRDVAPFDSWPDVEMASITCTEDRVVRPEWSDRIARERLHIEPLHIIGGHSPFLSRPDELAALLLSGL